MMKTGIPAPFSSTYSPQIPELLTSLNCSIAITTFQAGKVILISPIGNDNLVLLSRTFSSPMGIYADQKKILLATKDEVIYFVQSPQLAATYPNKAGIYDKLYIPIRTYYTGKIAIHDIACIRDEIYVVNTSFSCIAKLGEDYHFTPAWTPPFISALVSEDRCHLNGMAVDNGDIRYVTALGNENSAGGWRNKLPGGGILMETKTNRVLAKDLPMPHSPRIYEGKLYVLFSATGELVLVDQVSGSYKTIYKTKGFLRGLAKCRDYLFIGVSKLRNNSSSFASLELKNNALNAGIVIVHEPTGAFVGEIKFLASLDEIYDVQILNDTQRPNIMNTLTEDYKRALLIPDSSFWGEPFN
jgi:uncharacterized protein (TIGR03032 family)